MKTAIILWSLAMILVIAQAQMVEQELMVRPHRPSEFQREREVKAYLEKLRQWVEGSIATPRYGKRNLVQPKLKLNRNHLKQLKWKNDYDYYSQYNI